MRSALLAAIICVLTVPSLAQQVPEAMRVAPLQTCTVNALTVPTIAVEVVNGAVRSIVSREQDGGTYVFDFRAVPNSPGRSMETGAWRSSGLPGTASARFQQAVVQQDSSIILERWDFGETSAPQYQRLILRCAASR